MDKVLIDYGRYGKAALAVLALQPEDIVAFLLAVLAHDGRAVIVANGDDILVVSPNHYEGTK